MRAPAEDFAVGILKEVHRDHRRTIHEWNAPELGINYTAFEIHATMPLGNHFHAKKDETFHITAGAGIAVLEDMGPHTLLPLGERRVIPIKTGSIIFVRAFVAHTFIFEPGSRMTCHSSRPFDANDMDMTNMLLVAPADAAALLASTPTL